MANRALAGAGAKSYTVTRGAGNRARAGKWTTTSTTPSTTGTGAAPWRPSLGDPATRAASRVRPNRLAGCPNPGCPCFL
jgi:hypothetical protein